MNIEVPEGQERQVYGILLRARAAELSEKNRINRVAAAYHDRGWVQAPSLHQSRIDTLTFMIDQLKGKV